MGLRQIEGNGELLANRGRLAGSHPHDKGLTCGREVEERFRAERFDQLHLRFDDTAGLGVAGIARSRKVFRAQAEDDRFA